ncbi:MAG: DUF86 domain-containing protein [Methanocorpusculum sp.]|nr:DUF86 domain-containing protein [Methanocorpusculum sp.]
MTDDKNQLYLIHIFDELSFLREIRETTTYESLIDDKIKQRAVIRSIEVIGEAANNISAEFKNNHTDVPWRKLTDTRNRLIHGYFTVSMLIIWEIIDKETEPLLSKISALIKN